jgi:hypothetical protein
MMLAYPRHRRPASREAERGPGRPITVGRSHARLLRRREIHLVLKEAARLVKVKHGDTVEAITKHEAIVRRLFQMGMEGNIAAARLALFGFSQNPPSSAGEACGARCRRRVRASSIFCPRHRTATNERRRGCSTDSRSARYPRASRSARGDRDEHRPVGRARQRTFSTVKK